MAQSVERHLGKVEVAGSIPAISSIFFVFKEKYARVLARDIARIT